MFAARGAHVIKADEIAHRLMEPGTSVYASVVAAFGEEILHPGGGIDRHKLASVVFAASHPRVAELNRLVHPAVIAEQDRWSEAIARQDSQGIAMVEAALIFEAGVRGHFDRMLVVTCDPEQKIERLAARLHVSWEAARREVEARSRSQWSDTAKARLADFVIYNTGSFDQTAEQVDRVFDELKREAVQTHSD
jgi:dephospho-CoA kinase